jgi:hypothetical protein
LSPAPISLEKPVGDDEGRSVGAECNAKEPALAVSIGASKWPPRRLRFSARSGLALASSDTPHIVAWSGSDGRRHAESWSLLVEALPDPSRRSWAMIATVTTVATTMPTRTPKSLKTAKENSNSSTACLATRRAIGRRIRPGVWSRRCA